MHPRMIVKPPVANLYILAAMSSFLFCFSTDRSRAVLIYVKFLSVVVFLFFCGHIRTMTTGTETTEEQSADTQQSEDMTATILEKEKSNKLYTEESNR